MRLGALAFLGGILWFQQLAELPSISSIQLVLWLALLLLTVCVTLFYRALRPVLFLLAGFHWALFQANAILSAELPPTIVKQDVVVQGFIASLPQQQGRKWRFIFDIETMQHLGTPVNEPPRRVRLNWYGDAPALNVGDRWELTVRLKPPHGFMNPGGFDYEGWLFQQRIRATGYVRSAKENRRLTSESHHYPLQRLRQSLANRITTQLDQPDFKGIVMALAIGERQAITQPQWDVLRKTGTIHLVAISGLHIGLVAGMIFFVVQWLWPRIKNAALHWPAPRVAAIAGLMAALFYAALAGFTIPTQRAFIMVAVVMLMLFFQRPRRFSDTISLALIIVLVIDPFVVMSAGFWLSFGAVAAIIYAMSGRLARHDFWWRWGRVHLIVAVALLPLLLVTFQQVPLLSPIANFIAVPWVSFCVVPLVLLGTAISPLLPDVGALLLNGAATALAWLWPLLESLAVNEQGLWQQHAPEKWTLLPALIGILLLLSPRGIPARWLGMLWLLPLFLATPTRPAEGEWWFTLLDVGQGLAAVVQTENRTLVYDTGPRFSDSFDTGSAVVVPFLRDSGVSAVDLLLISHGDNDHIGGANSVISQIKVKKIITSVPEKITSKIETSRCEKGMQWQWDNLLFEILHPPPRGFKGNNASCVVSISAILETGQLHNVLLLSGDIERAAERALLESGRDKLSTQIVVAPHHGSKSSSTDAFVTATAPAHVLFPVGELNRYAFPHPTVVQRYQAQRAKVASTAENGAMTFRINAAGEVMSIEHFRPAQRRYWHSK